MDEIHYTYKHVKHVLILSIHENHKDVYLLENSKRLNRNRNQNY